MGSMPLRGAAQLAANVDSGGRLENPPPAPSWLAPPPPQLASNATIDIAIANRIFNCDVTMSLSASKTSMISCKCRPGVKGNGGASLVDVIAPQERV